MRRYFLNKLIAFVLIFAVSSVRAESTADDSIRSLPAPTKKSTWRASAFAGCALLAVVGGVFAICWSGGGNTPKCHKDHGGSDSHHHHHRRPHCEPPRCPNTVTADCMAGSCIYHEKRENQGCGCTDGGWNGQQQVINGAPPCCSVNGGVPPF